MNDLGSFLSNCNLDGLNTNYNKIEFKLNTYLTLFVILYADVSVAELPADLQRHLDSLQDYRSKWKLINADKSKIMFFSRGTLPTNHSFNLYRIEL